MRDDSDIRGINPLSISTVSQSLLETSLNSKDPPPMLTRDLKSEDKEVSRPNPITSLIRERKEEPGEKRNINKCEISFSGGGAFTRSTKMKKNVDDSSKSVI